MRTRRHVQSAGFTLTELIAIICVLAYLGSVAIPKFIDLRERASASALAGDFRIIANAGWSYYRDTSSWAPDSWHSFPPELLTYFESYQQVGNLGTPLAADSIYDWNGPPFVSATGLVELGPSFSVQPNNGVTNHRWFTNAEVATIERMDRLIDDGDQNTGRLRWGFYYFNLP